MTETTLEGHSATETITETKRTRRLGELRWCKHDDREGWLTDVDVPDMADCPDTTTAKRLLQDFLNQPGSEPAEGVRFRLVRVVEEVTPTVEVKRSIRL